MDLTGWAMLPRAVLIAVLVLFGFVPRAILDVINGTTVALLERF